MSPSPTVSAEAIALLAKASPPQSPTQLFRRGLRGQFIQAVKRLGGGEKAMAGPAYTLRYIPAREDLDVVEAFQDPTHPQRVAVETTPAGHVLVMDCRRDPSAASIGGILALRLEVGRCAGLVTDGGVRDASDISALGLPCFCAGPSAPTNLTRHHAVDINVPDRLWRRASLSGRHPCGGRGWRYRRSRPFGRRDSQAGGADGGL